ncbi:hypothetical protein GCM10023238_10350 [Streptomyces heliomycini]
METAAPDGGRGPRTQFPGVSSDLYESEGRCVLSRGTRRSNPGPIAELPQTVDPHLRARIAAHTSSPSGDIAANNTKHARYKNGGTKQIYSRLVPKGRVHRGQRNFGTSFQL